MSEALPAYTPEALEAATVEELMRMLQRDEDRVPRNVIDECARRGDLMLDAIEGVLEKDYYWGEDQSDGEWWRLVHAVMILGLMDSQRAGELLVAYMRRISDAEDDVLHELLSGYWPAFFANKPAEVLPALHELGEDRAYPWYVRGDAANSAVAWIAARAGAELEPALDRIARTAFSRNEDFDLRVMLGATLLAFARARDRRGLEQLSDAQSDELRWFGREAIVRSYALGGEAPDWQSFANPWEFYEPEHMEMRRQASEAAPESDEDDNDYVDEPYVREAPKVGRNDPCPCGSGKKYKKCCGA